MSKRILDLNTISSASNDDYLVVDGNSGTRKITPENIVGNSDAVHALEEHVGDVADDVDGLQINMGKAQGDIEELKNLVGVFVADVDESVRAWLNDHPEATTTVQDGAITEAKLNADLKAFVNNVKDAFQINNKFVKSIIFADYLSGLSGTYSPQGFCYDPYRDVFIFCFSKGTEESLLVKTDTNFEYISRVELPLYHCNDITCDEDNYYIAFGSNATNYNIGIVNASNMAIYESVTIPTLGSIAAIQYYEGAFYAFCETGLYKLDDLESNPVLLTQIERPSNYIGSMAGFNDSIIIPFWYAENDESVFEYAVVNLQSLTISRFYLNGADRTDELEGVTIYDGKILTYSYSGNYLNVYETRQNDLTERNYNSIKRIRYTTSSTVLEDVVDNIPANNPIVNYVQFSNSHPDLGGFNGVLISYMYNSPKYGFQVFVSENGIFKRNISNGSFSDFEKVLTSSDDTTTSVRLSNNTITKGITFYKKRGIISVHSSGDLAASTAGTYDYGTLPEAYRPVVPVCIMPQNNVSPKCYIRIESSGVVKLYVLETTTSASNACMNMSYISAN